MTIKVGDHLPEAVFNVLTDDGMKELHSNEIFSGKTVALFALPGAFTPTCSAAHLPGFVVSLDKFKEKGVDTVACLSVNDAFVMKAWGDSANAENILMLADGSAAFTKAIGMDLDLTARGMGVRSCRYSMLVKDREVIQLNIEEPGKFEVSDAETLLSQI